MNNELVDAACCIANNNKNLFRQKMFDIESHFDGWKKAYVKQRLIDKFGKNANI